MVKRWWMVFLLASPVYANSENFAQFLDDIRHRALHLGISENTIERALDGIFINNRVLDKDRYQAEFNQTFSRYFELRVSENRVDNGRKILNQHQKILRKIYAEYGVAPHILVAFFGLESNYGKTTGDFHAVRSLATLGFDARRSAFFSEQLLALLTLMDAGKIPIDVQSSWAGALGAVQFMPSNVEGYGVDKNADGAVDLWKTPADIFASAANFLINIGWQPGERWGRVVRLPENFDYQNADLALQKKISEWRDLGVKTADGKLLPPSELEASVIVPAGHRGPAFLVYPNFRVILRWNASIFYALSVGHLSDRLIGAEDLIIEKTTERPLRKNEVVIIQQKLNALGFNAGAADGIVGAKTRAATRHFQKSIGAVADGYVGRELFERLHNDEN